MWTPQNNAMTLTRLQAAPGSSSTSGTMEAPPNALRRLAPGRTVSRLIASVRRTPMGRWRGAMRGITLAWAVCVTVLAGAVGAEPQPADVGPGRIAWFDITTSSLSRSQEFYGKLFGWEFRPVKGTSQAVEIVAGGTAIGTLRVAEGQISAFNGLVYVQVTDMQGSCAKAEGLGGTVAPGFPFDLPDGGGAVGLVVDPAGHPVGMYSRVPLPSEEPSAR